jgi:two-component system, cell cycle sensor histidine kinase and response regulator CckA
MNHYPTDQQTATPEPRLPDQSANGSGRENAERKSAETQLSELNRLLRAIRGIHRLIVRERDPNRLLEEACNILVQTRGYALAWVGLAEPGTRRVVPAARAGRHAGYLDAVTVTWDRSPTGRGPTGSAMRAARPCVSQDTAVDPLFAPWREAALACGLASVAAVPLVQGVRTLGALTVYSDKANSFHEDELELLTEVASDLAFAMQSIEQDKERLRVEEDLRIAGERFHSVWENSIDGMRLTDREGRVVAVNAAYCQLVKLPREKLEGALYSVVYQGRSPGGDLESYQEHFEAGRVAPRLSAQTRLWNDEEVDLEISSSFIDLGRQGKVLFSIFRNTTEGKQIEAQLRQSQKLEAIGQLAGGVAHDFNNMLSVIRGNAELMLMDGDALSTEGREFLSHITSAAERAANLTRQLLIFSRKQVMQPQPVALNDLITNLTKMLKRVIREDITLQCVNGDPAPFVHADPGMLEQVLVNLVVNARDAMPMGGRLEISTHAERLEADDIRTRHEAHEGDFVCLTVRDTGSGISPEILPRIFEPFFTTKEMGKGTGLGLATVYGVIKQHKGWVEVSSRLGVGTTFKIYLPAIPMPTMPSALSPAEAGPRGGTETILLVEDEYAVRVITRRVLESYGYKVLEAASAREALEVWRPSAGEIDMLITDMVMPEGITGRDLGERLRAQKPELKVIFMSGYSAEVVGGDPEFMRQHGNYFLHKPCAAGELIRTVRQCLDRK